MKLLYSPASPFVRTINVLLHETDQTGDVERLSVKTSPLAVAAEVKAANPVGKIPALIRSDGPTLYDSRVITRFLDARAGGALYPEKQLWEVLTLEATAHGIMDAAILVTYEGRTRPEEFQYEPWVSGQWDRVVRSVEALNSRWMSHLAGPLDMGQVAVACALGYLDFRHDARNWRHDNDALAAWYAEFSQRDSMQATAPHD